MGRGPGNGRGGPRREKQEKNSLSWFIAQTAPFGLVLAAAEDIPDQAFPAEQALFCWRQTAARFGAGGCRGRHVVVPTPTTPVEAGLDQREAPADPVAVAAVDQLVGAPGEAALGRVLPRRQPGDQPWNVEGAGSCRHRQHAVLLSPRVCVWMVGRMVADTCPARCCVLTSGCCGWGGLEAQGSPARRRRTPRGLRRWAGPRCRLRMFGLGRVSTDPRLVVGRLFLLAYIAERSLLRPSRGLRCRLRHVPETRGLGREEDAAGK